MHNWRTHPIDCKDIDDFQMEDRKAQSVIVLTAH